MTSERAGGVPVEASGGVQSVDRAVEVLEILARTGGSAVGEVATELGVHKSTASRLLSALEGRNLVEQDGDRGRYRLGFGLLRLAGAVVGRLDLARQADSVLQELANDLGETVNLAVLRGHYAVNVADARGQAAIAAQNWVGRLTPLHATSSGKILLAHETTLSRKQLLDTAGLTRFTPNTIVNRRVLNQEIERILADGYAIALEEFEEGLNAVAAAVRDHTGTVVASVTVSGPAYRLDKERAEKIVHDVVAAGAQISIRMGHLS